MEKKNDNLRVQEKLEEIRLRLTGDPTHEELTKMQLNLDVLEKWARIVSLSDADHQHNHMTDHDNSAFVEPFVVLNTKDLTADIKDKTSPK